MIEFCLTSQKSLICRGRLIKTLPAAGGETAGESERNWKLRQGKEAKQKVEVTRSKRSRTDKKEREEQVVERRERVKRPGLRSKRIERSHWGEKEGKENQEFLDRGGVE